MQIVESAELFVIEKHAGVKKGNGVFYLDHLKGVVTRLKNLGITDQEVLAAAWLHDIMYDAKATFDEIDKIFGSRVSVLVLALFKDSSLPKSQIEKQYVRQLSESSLEAKMIKLCDISTCLKELKNTPWSKTRRTKQVKKELYYLNIIKHELSKAKNQYLGIQNIVNGINEVITSHGQRPIAL
ncbi:MAG: HD domain-containing protein [Nitrosotalea sp.]